MMIPDARVLILNGAILSVLASLGGAVYGRMLIAHSATDQQRQAWRLVHSAGSLIGVALVALGAAFPALELDPVLSGLIVWSGIATGYLFLLGMVVAALSGQRGLQPAGSPGNQLVYAAYLAGSVATLVLWAAVIWAALR
jgi:hypothetical protein